MRRALTTIIAIMFCVVAAVSFAGGRAEVASGEIMFGGWSAEEPANRPVIFGMLDVFRAENPDVTIEWVGYPWGDVRQNFVLRYRNNEAPHIVQLQERWLSTFAALDAFVDLNEVIGRQELERLMDPGLLAFANVDGKQIAIPWTAGSVGMVANTRVLEQAGVREIPTTIDDFTNALRAIKRSNPDVVPYAMATTNNASMLLDFQIWLWTHGGRLFDDAGSVTVNSPQGVQTLEYLVGLMQEGLVERGVDRPDSRRLFAQHETGFYFDAPLARGFARTNSGQGEAFDQFIVAMPTPVLNQGDDPQSVAWGHLLALFKQPGQTVTRESAQTKLLEYFSFDTRPQMAYFEATGLFPVSRDALALPQVQNDAYVATWTASAAFARNDEPSMFPNSGEMTTVVGEEVQSALLGQKTPRQAIADMQARLEQLVADVR